MRKADLESDYRRVMREHYFEDPNYRKWSDIKESREYNYYGSYRERAFIRCYLSGTYGSGYESGQAGLSKIRHIMSNGASHPINWGAFYAYFDERLNDPENPYVGEMDEKMFPLIKDSPTVIELLNQYRETLLPPPYDIV